MGNPTQAEIVCWTLRELGGSAKVEQIRLTAEGKFGSPAWLRPSSPTLTLLLARENGRLWARIAPGTYRLTKDGEAAVASFPAGSSSTSSLDEGW